MAALLLTLLFAASQDFLADGLKALDGDKPEIAEPLLREALGDILDNAVKFIKASRNEDIILEKIPLDSVEGDDEQNAKRQKSFDLLASAVADAVDVYVVIIVLIRQKPDLLIGRCWTEARNFYPNTRPV